MDYRTPDLIKLVHPCHRLTGHSLKELTAMRCSCSVISILLLEHSFPVVLQLLNAVLNVSEGAVSTILPAKYS